MKSATNHTMTRPSVVEEVLAGVSIDEILTRVTIDAPRLDMLRALYTALRAGDIAREAVAAIPRTRIEAHARRATVYPNASLFSVCEQLCTSNDQHLALLLTVTGALPCDPMEPEERAFPADDAVDLNAAFEQCAPSRVDRFAYAAIEFAGPIHPRYALACVNAAAASTRLHLASCWAARIADESVRRTAIVFLARQAAATGNLEWFTSEHVPDGMRLPQSVLTLASRNGHLDVARWLLAHGHDAHPCALDFAARHNRVRLVDLLIERGVHKHRHFSVTRFTRHARRHHEMTASLRWLVHVCSASE